jgi:toxin ParE1/3/4
VRVLFTASAERQLDSLHRYIADRAGERTADHYVERIILFCEGLSTFPLQGARRDDLLLGLRTIGFERRATIAFMVTADAVVVEGVFYGGQDFEANFRE